MFSSFRSDMLGGGASVGGDTSSGADSDRERPYSTDLGNLGGPRSNSAPRRSRSPAVVTPPRAGGHWFSSWKRGDRAQRNGSVTPEHQRSSSVESDIQRAPAGFSLLPAASAVRPDRALREAADVQDNAEDDLRHAEFIEGQPPAKRQRTTDGRAQADLRPASHRDTPPRQVPVSPLRTLPSRTAGNVERAALAASHNSGAWGRQAPAMNSHSPPSSRASTGSESVRTLSPGSPARMDGTERERKQRDGGPRDRTRTAVVAAAASAASSSSGGNRPDPLTKTVSRETQLALMVTSHVRSGLVARGPQQDTSSRFEPFSRTEAGMVPLTPDELREKERWKVAQRALDVAHDKTHTIAPGDGPDEDAHVPVVERLRMLMQVPVENVDNGGLDYLLVKWMELFVSKLQGTSSRKCDGIARALFGHCESETEQMRVFEEIVGKISHLRRFMSAAGMLGGRPPAVAVASGGAAGTSSEEPGGRGEALVSSRVPRNRFDGGDDVASHHELVQGREQKFTQLNGAVCKMYFTRWVTQRDLTHFSLDLLKAQVDRVRDLIDSTGESKRERRVDDRKPTDFQTLLELVLSRIAELKLVRIKGKICEPVLNEHGLWTRSYREHGEMAGREGEIRDFVEGCAYPEKDNKEFFDLLNARTNYPEMLEKRLATLRNERFPEVERERNWHSFRNGMFDVALAQFIPYDSARFAHLPPGRSACSYHNTVYDDLEYRWYLRDLETRPLAFMDIPTPVDQICHVQEWPQDERVWIFAEGGALVFSKKTATHPLRAHIPCHIGPGGIGKTTLLKMYSDFYNPLDVAQFKTKDEDVFGYERLPEAYIFMGYDIGKHWTIDHTFLYTLIDGGWIKINCKFKKHVMYYVEQYGMLAMNEYLNLPDTGGAWSRRNLLHIWSKPPPDGGDRTMPEKGRLHMGAILLKCVLALRYLCVQLKGKSICKDTLPKSMADNLEQMRRDTNPLISFFDSPEVVKDAEHKFYIDMVSFNEAFVEWFKKQSTRAKSAPSLNQASCQDVLFRNHCKMVDGVRPSPTGSNSLVETSWIVGCTLARHVSTVKAIIDSGILEPDRVGTAAGAMEDESAATTSSQVADAAATGAATVHLDTKHAANGPTGAATTTPAASQSAATPSPTPSSLRSGAARTGARSPLVATDPAVPLGAEEKVRTHAPLTLRPPRLIGKWLGSQPTSAAGDGSDGVERPSQPAPAPSQSTGASTSPPASRQRTPSRSSPAPVAANAAVSTPPATTRRPPGARLPPWRNTPSTAPMSIETR